MGQTVLFVKMATDVVVPLLENQFDRLSVASEESIVRSDASKEDQDDPVIEEWGLPLKELYRLAINFYKEKEGKAVHLSYPDKLRLVALKTQVSRGPYSDAGASLPPLGVLDVIGRDRRTAWQSLGSMSRQDAMLGFIDLLRVECALFTPSVQAARTDMIEQQRIKQEQEQRRKEEEQRAQEELERKQKEEEEQSKQEAQRRQVQDALNAQTYGQFVAYCRAQFPGNADRQATLLRQLQEHHYAQYMRQLAAGPPPEATPPPPPTPPPDNEEQEDSDADDAPQASMWTRKDVLEFKAAIRREASDAVIRVGHGETVTVRVPTHPDGACLFWEFATDAHDIGFGVFFEWTAPSTNQVSVHVAESDDEDDEEDDDEDEGSDLERSVGSKGGVDLPLRPPTSVIVPVYRRDCQEEVYAGSHVYPGQGVYLLKFDNSYSLWRSKTLYYRVYYTR